MPSALNVGKEAAQNNDHESRPAPSNRVGIAGTQGREPLYSLGANLELGQPPPYLVVRVVAFLTSPPQVAVRAAYSVEAYPELRAPLARAYVGPRAGR